MKNPSPAFTALETETRWAESLASRLRLVMSTSADDTPDNRAACLDGEIRRELESVPPARRASYLDALGEKFPTADRVVGSTPSGLSAADPAPPPPSVDAILSLLQNAVATLGAEERQTVVARLNDMGLIEPAPAEPFAELRQRLGFGVEEPMAGQRAERLAAQLVELFLRLDQLAWNTWRALAPRSPHKRDGNLTDLRGFLRKHLRGDGESAEASLAQHLERTRQLVASLLGALSQAGRGIVARHQTRHSPEAIRAVVEAEKSQRYLLTRDTRCWRKYVELAAEITEATLEAETQEVVARYVDELMRGHPRPAN